MGGGLHRLLPQRPRPTPLNIPLPPSPPHPPRPPLQVLVQGMMANRYMSTFRDEILGWNKKLMNVADVNQIMGEIQRTWAYLESLFIHSEEVCRAQGWGACAVHPLRGGVQGPGVGCVWREGRCTARCTARP